MDKKNKKDVNVKKEDKNDSLKSSDTVDEEALKLKEQDKALSKKEEIFIDNNAINRKIDEKAEKYKNKIKIKGFRPGKVPVAYVKQYLYKDLLEETIDDFMRENIKKILDKVENLATYPNITKKYEEDKGLTIKIQYELLPKIELPDYKGIEVEDYKTTATKKEIDAEIERLSAQVAEIIPLEKDAIIDDDELILDFEFQIKNPNTGKWMKKEILKDRKLKFQTFMDVNKHLKGMKVGEEKIFKGIIPDKLAEKSFAGKETEARIKILSAKKYSIPEINDDFAKSLGEYKTLKELKDKIKQAIQDKKKSEKTYILGSRVIDKLAKEIDFGVPVSFIFEEMNRLFKEGAKYDPATSLKVSRENIKKQLILTEIATQEKIEITQKDIDKYIENYAKSMGYPPHLVKQALKEEQIKEIEQSIRIDKVITLLGENAKIKQKISKTKEKTDEKPKTTKKKTVRKTSVKTTEKKEEK